MTGVCEICGDTALGNNFGVLSCFGCKSFFQRSVRKNLVYECKDVKNCVMEKRRRNHCRYCRFQKCLLKGMKRESVQEARDKLLVTRTGRRNTTPATSSAGILDIYFLTTPCTDSFSKILEAEEIANLLVGCAPGPIFDMNYFIGPDGCFNNRQVQHEGKKLEFLLAIEFARHVPSFQALGLRDQVELLRAHIGELFLLDMVKRSLNGCPDNMLVLGNGFPVHRDAEDSPVSRIRTINEVLKPLKRILLNEQELLCLKAVVLLDPTKVPLTEPEKVSKMRFQAQLMLEDFVMNQAISMGRGRLSEMLLTLIPLFQMRVAMSTVFQLVKDLEIPKTNRYVEELVYGVNEEMEPRHHYLADMPSTSTYSQGVEQQAASYSTSTSFRNFSYLSETMETSVSTGYLHQSETESEIHDPPPDLDFNGILGLDIESIIPSTFEVPDALNPAHTDTYLGQSDQFH